MRGRRGGGGQDLFSLGRHTKSLPFTDAGYGQEAACPPCPLNLPAPDPMLGCSPVPDGAPSPPHQVRDMAKKLGAAGLQLLVIDTENKFVSTGFAEEIAKVRRKHTLPAWAGRRSVGRLLDMDRMLL